MRKNKLLIACVKYGSEFIYLCRFLIKIAYLLLDFTETPCVIVHATTLCHDMNKWVGGSHMKKSHWHFAKHDTKSWFICPTHNESRELPIKVLDQIHRQYGRGAVKTATELLGKSWHMRQELRSPRYTTCWEELLEVKWVLRFLLFAFKEASVLRCPLFWIFDSIQA